MSSPASQISWRRECDDHGVWTLWFDQPGRSYNVLDRPAIDELESQLADAEADPSIAGLILRGGKPGGFCAGADLKTVLACRTRGEVEQLLRRGLTVLDRLSSVRVPHGRGHPRRLSGRRPGAGPGVPAARGPRLRGAAPGRIAGSASSDWSPPGAGSPGSPGSSIPTMPSTSSSRADRSDTSAPVPRYRRPAGRRR